MWVLVAAMSFYYGGAWVVLPNAYPTEQECKSVGDREHAARRISGFRCLSLRSSP